MKSKKLIKAVKAEDKKILERNKDRLAEIKEEYFPKEVKKKLEFPVILKRYLLPIFATCIILVISTVLILDAIKPKDSGDPVYLDGNELVADSNFEELITNLTDISFNFEGFNIVIEKYYDSKSGDTLRFQIVLSTADTLKKAKINVRANKYYNFKYSIETPNTKTLDNDVKVDYFEKFERDFLINYLVKGLVDVEVNKVYIEYEQTMLAEEEAAFWDFLDEIIIFK